MEVDNVVLEDELKTLMDTFGIDLVVNTAKQLATPGSPLRWGKAGVSDYVIRVAFYVDTRYREWSRTRKAGLISKITDTDFHVDTLKRLYKREQFPLWRQRVYDAENTDTEMFEETAAERNAEDEALLEAIRDFPQDLRILVSRKIKLRRPLMDAIGGAIAELSPRDRVKYALQLDDEIFSNVAEVRSRQQFIRDFLGRFSARIREAYPELYRAAESLRDDFLQEIDGEIEEIKQLK